MSKESDFSAHMAAVTQEREYLERETRVASLVQRYTDALANALRVSTRKPRIVLDENLQGLAPALNEKFTVTAVPSGMKDDQIKDTYLYQSGQVIITRNTKDFVEDASAYEYGVVSLEALRFIDPAPSFAKNGTAQLIHKAFRDHRLDLIRRAFLCVLYRDKQSSLVDIDV